MSDKRQWDAGASYAGLAVQMGVIIAIGAYGGVRLDRWLDLSPLFVIVLLQNACGKTESPNLPKGF